jgi:hypothetical protein
MRRAITASLLIIGLGVVPAAAQVAADDAQAQQPRPRPGTISTKPQKPRDPIGFRVYFGYDTVSMTASDSFNATLGTSTMTGFGGGGEVLNLWKGLFARVTVASMSDTGTRVVIVDNAVIPLDIPLDVSLRTVEVGAGWRVPIRTKPKPPTRPAVPARPGAKPAPARFAVYGGAGFLNVSYKEESQFATTTDNNRASFGGYDVFGGFDVLIAKWVFAGVEGQYRGVANALGESGVSKAYGETDLGGAAFRVLVGIRK